MEEESDQQRSPPSLAMFGTSLGVGSAVLILGGYWMDQRAGGGYTRTLLGLLLAILYVAYETWKLTRMIAATGKKNADAPPSEPPDTKADQ